MKIQRAGMDTYLINDKLVYIEESTGLIAYDIIYHRGLFPNKSKKSGLKAQIEHFEVDEIDHMALLTSFSTSGPASGFNRLEIWRHKNRILKHNSGSFGFGYGYGREDIYQIIHQEHEENQEYKRVYFLCNNIDFYRSQNKGKFPYTIPKEVYKHLLVFSNFIKAEKKQIQIPQVDKTKTFILKEIEKFRQLVWSTEFEIEGEKLRIEYSYIPNFSWSEEKRIQSFWTKTYLYHEFSSAEDKLEFFINGKLIKLKEDEL